MAFGRMTWPLVEKPGAPANSRRGGRHPPKNSQTMWLFRCGISSNSARRPAFPTAQKSLAPGSRGCASCGAFNPLRAAIPLIGGDKTGDDRWYSKFVPVTDRLFERHLAELSTVPTSASAPFRNTSKRWADGWKSGQYSRIGKCGLRNSNWRAREPALTARPHPWLSAPLSPAQAAPPTALAPSRRPTPGSDCRPYRSPARRSRYRRWTCLAWCTR